MIATSCSFCFYLINFYVKYLPGDIYTNQIVNSVAESASNGVAIVLVAVIGVKRGFVSSFVSCLIACIVVMYAEAYEHTWIIPFGVLGAKSGITIAFCFLYFSPSRYFEQCYLGLVMGASNTIGRASTIAAPIVAEMRNPIPMVSCILLCLAALVCATILEKP